MDLSAEECFPCCDGLSRPHWSSFVAQEAIPGIQTPYSLRRGQMVAAEEEAVARERQKAGR
ncbi:hypothetical protein C5E02_10565 [Rathayibacter rathayi]|uniref:Uncharacterized protein n=1 Tax=Rathayibacter rathayi TaxID=33887 RepID=A0ABD6W632_RATRA|nr:hypothetical protein C1O28_10860 [Rathayibacter rathayi]PPF10892.1 hypothetical protein C5C04_12780 [Rathayibacter rathayi]PPF44367.1 hypothetical protein C5C08_13280 [Rathayibacter rathayi]PPF75483.1 hypothetical protein C5C14_13720 [Rathayibacter rathayi]PPG12357.1 hypothetical protein C5C11_09705 [Rathayibacter rathayi]